MVSSGKMKGSARTVVEKPSLLTNSPYSENLVDTLVLAGLAFNSLITQHKEIHKLIFLWGSF